MTGFAGPAAPAENTDDQTVGFVVSVNGNFAVTANPFTQSGMFIWCVHLPGECSLLRATEIADYNTLRTNGYPVGLIDPNYWVGAKEIFWDIPAASSVLMPTLQQCSLGPPLMGVSGTAPFGAGSTVFEQARSYEGEIYISSSASPANSTQVIGSVWGANLQSFRSTQHVTPAEGTQSSVPAQDQFPLSAINVGGSAQIEPDARFGLRHSLPSGISNGQYACGETGVTVLADQEVSNIFVYPIWGNQKMGVPQVYAMSGATAGVGNNLGGIWITTGLTPISLGTGMGSVAIAPANIVKVSTTSPVAQPHIEILLDMAVPGSTPTLPAQNYTGPMALWHLYAAYDDQFVGTPTPGVSQYGKFIWQWVEEIFEPVVAAGFNSPFAPSSAAGLGTFQGTGPFTGSNTTDITPSPYEPALFNQVVASTNGVLIKSSPIQIINGPTGCPFMAWQGCMLVNLDQLTDMSADPRTGSNSFPVIRRVRFGTQDGDYSSSSPSRILAYSGCAQGQQIVVGGNYYVQARSSQSGATWTRSGVNQQFKGTELKKQQLAAYSGPGINRRVYLGQKHGRQ